MSQELERYEADILQMHSERVGLRTIAGWLKDRGVQVSHMVVSRFIEKSRSGKPPTPPPPVSISIPVAQAPNPLDEEKILAKLNELALSGHPVALKLAIEQEERRAKVALIEAQTRNLKLRNRVLSEHLGKKGIELGADEWEPEEDPVQAPRRGLKAVGE